MATTAASCLPAAATVVIQALKADAALVAALGQDIIETLPPENAAPPYVIVLTGRERPNNTLGGTFGSGGFGRIGTLNVIVVSRYLGTKEVDLLASRIMQVLDNTEHDLDPAGYPGNGRLTWLETDELTVETVNNEVYFERRLLFEMTVA